MSWKSGATDFSLASLILIVVLSGPAILRFVVYPLWPAKFGARIAGDAPTVAVQVGVDPASGQPIIAQHPLATHWSTQPAATWAATTIQGIIFILFLSAMAADVWSVYSVNDSTMDWGVVRTRTSGTNYFGFKSINYNTLCDAQSGSDKTPCGTLRATGAFTLTYSLVCIINMVIVWTKLCLIGCRSAIHRWETWQYQLAVLQTLLLTISTLLWPLGGHIVIKESGVGVALGSSWGLTLTCFILSIGIVYFFKCAIEYRRNGDPIPYLPAPVAHIAIVQSGVVSHGGPAIIVNPMYAAHPQAAPGMAYAQPAYVGQPHQMQPAPQYAQPIYSPQPQQYQPSYPPPQAQAQPQPHNETYGYGHPQAQPQYGYDAPPPAYSASSSEGGQPLYPPPRDQHSYAPSQPQPSQSSDQIPVTWPSVEKPKPQ